LAGAILVLFAVRASAAPQATAAGSNAFVRQAQVLEAERTGVPSPVGLAFSAAGSAFFVVDGPLGGGSRPAETDIVKLTPFKLSPETDRAGSARIAAAVKDPINVAFDARRNRLLLLDQADRLLEVQVDANGDLDPATLARRDALRLDLQNPQGMAVDPGSGVLYILDAAQPRLLRVEPAPDGSFEQALISEVDLRPTGLGALRGLAFDPATGHLQAVGGQKLHELTQAGQPLAVRDLSDFDLASPQGLVFAPSGDQTDDPGQLSVYLADSGGTQSSGQIVELSLTPLPSVASIDFTSSLVNTVNMAAFSPPSPDPSGVTYLSASDRLVISDGEVEETVNGITHFQGANVWELTRSGSVVRTANISTIPPTEVPMTNEPAGAAFNPANGHYYFTADGAKRVFDLNPGADALLGTGDDTWTFFRTDSFGNGDPEGITYDTFGGRLFVADGVNREIYQYTTAGALVGQFDVLQYGVEDPESVEFNPVSGTLFILSNEDSGPNADTPIIIETTTSGTLLQTLDMSASNALKPAGLAYAPASDGSGAKRFYIVDRGIDNNADPNIVDGKMYEMTAPAPGAPTNTPPVVDAGTDQEVTLPAAATLDGTVTDDGQPNPPGAVTTTWSQVTGPGTVTFGDAGAIDTTASVPVPGTYVVRLTASDGEFTSFDDVTLTFTGSGSVAVLDVRVNANPDDAEEVAVTGLVQRGDGDLDMMTDSSDTKLVVGMRFNGITIPPGANITSAYVQFQADEVHSVPTSLTIKGQAHDNAPTFQAVNFDISSRPTTTAAASWSPDAWLAVGDAGLAQRTSNLAGIVQEIVDRPGWASSNSLVLLVTGSGRRVAVAYNQIPTAAPLLHVEWASNNAPVITSDGGGGNASVDAVENQTAVTDVDATDPDAGDTLIYSIVGGADAALFTIDSASGVLSFLNAPDFEAPADANGDNVYEVTVRASDGSLFDQQAIAATVHNVNEFAPVITSNGGGDTASLSVAENQTAVTTVTATDADLEALIYLISGGADAALFTIDEASGVLTFVSAPDFEAPADANADNVYEVTVLASDGSRSDTQALSVTVTDVVNENNNPPVITSDGGGATASKSVPENETAVTDVDATDPDAGDTLSYSISGGPDAARFQIDGSSGILTFVTAPNFEAPTDQGGNNVYDVTVSVSDGNGGSDSQAIAVTVTNVNEFAPVINSNGGGDTAPISVPENSTAVTDVDATDGDNDTLSYSISGGADAALFSIVPSTGVLTFTSAPDFENPTDADQNNVYEVTVRASDGTLFDEQALSVTVTDVLDNASPLYFSLGSSAVVGGVSAANEDIVFFDGTAGFSLSFDGSDVGIASFRIDAFAWLDADTLLLSFTAAGSVPGIGIVDDSDIVRFDATSLGTITTGGFSLYFDGSDVGLTANAHDVDAIELLPDGRILISTVGSVTVPGVAAGRDEDLLAFAPTSLGDVTAGTFSMYFDGSDVGLGTEDVDAAAVDASGNIYLSVIDVFAVTGVSGDDEDVFVFDPTSTGEVTQGSYLPRLYFDGSAFGLAANDVSAIDLP
jgi:uncharacterized protein YjiK